MAGEENQDASCSCYAAARTHRSTGQVLVVARRRGSVPGHAGGGSSHESVPFLYLLEPGCPNDNYDLIEWEDQQTEALEGLWKFEKKPDELADAGSRVIPWATAVWDDAPQQAIGKLRTSGNGSPRPCGSDTAIRRIIGTTNAIESVNARIRRAGRAAGKLRTAGPLALSGHRGGTRPAFGVRSAKT